ncbi:putative phage replication protein [Sodalis glossinidius str. 'morsitans']|uniref:Phage replication protein n=1 Tax=Sodalis glossinidius (strain morsitans) TaxID=343509 RepID=Q2NRI4_SODGM|nr:putative phage replication protein [Sodalis glossinidius str. 'morsitans']
MSMSLIAKAMNIKVGNPIRKLVLLKLADNANDKGECWPSYQHIADHCECSKSTVRDHIDALEKAGLLVKENRTGTNNGKGNTFNVYHLKLDNPMPTPSTPPMPTGGTRISHSFEPVMEPKTPYPLPGASPRNRQEKTKPPTKT